ncbi:hydroxyacylglutathione hydrolase [Clavulina sp. PMI_390]|nr:hydroxyacylglutathione hydrolase [Clavulina sp. PMI_390]
MKVVAVPVRSDNYAYLLVDTSSSGRVAVVDPFDVTKVEAALKAEGIAHDKVDAVLTTHHHDDHAGGNVEFAKKFPGVTVYGGSNKVAGLTKQVGDQDKLQIGSLNVRCLATPCHTQDSICFNVEDAASGERGVFTGDTLFIAGCGRFFEGTADEMDKALSYLGSLPDETVVYVGHEYTAGNAAFALSVDPANEAIKKLSKIAEAEKITTGKSTIGDEKKWNVFMRLESGPVRKSTGTSDRSEVMQKLREMKNGFSG